MTKFDRVYEFMFRGALPEEGRPNSAWHVVLGGTVSVFGVDKFMPDPRGPIPPNVAEAEGWPLTAVMTDINATALTERDAEVDAHNVTKAKAQELSDTLDKVAAVATDALDRAAAHEANVADLQAQLDALKAEADAQADEATKLADDGPSNPVLHTLTLGLLGK